jgi:uncharacterized protein YyaL (SSP411 family)
MAAAREEFHFSPRPNRAAEIGWRAWSAEAFEESRATGKPILLSISAVWCHWCHVMDETTYSNAGVIDIINREYVPVRVDNDVRPDINQRYNMGGWPTTAFLTSSGDILTGGTYLPPEQMASALTQVASYYRLHQAEIASQVLEARRRSGAELSRAAGELDPATVDEVLEAVKRAYDPDYGGFGPAPKFPQTEALLLLLEQSALRGDAHLREMAVHTLEQMTGGGTYDHVEGGFFRYSTTQDWSVPHFEKMLEDHGGLVLALSLAGMTAELDRTMAYLDRVLRDPDTGLYAGSQDADEHYYSLDAAAVRRPPRVHRVERGPARRVPRRRRPPRAARDPRSSATVAGCARHPCRGEHAERRAAAARRPRLAAARADSRLRGRPRRGSARSGGRPRRAP